MLYKVKRFVRRITGRETPLQKLNRELKDGYYRRGVGGR